MSGRANTLLKLVQKHGWTRGAELGLWMGQTSSYLLEHARALSLIGVDKWECTVAPPKDKETGHVNYEHKDMERAEAVCMDYARQFHPRFLIIKGDTGEAAKDVKDASLDFVFVDATHTTDAVMIDILAWLPKIKKGGAMTGHDADWPSVKRALGILRMDYEVLPGNVWVHWV